MNRHKYYIIDTICAAVGLTVGLLLAGLISSYLSPKLELERGYSAPGGEVFLYGLVFAVTALLIFYMLAYAVRFIEGVLRK